MATQIEEQSAQIQLRNKEEEEIIKPGQREIEEKEYGNRKNGEEKEMKPWEQHSAVISIPRYDYKAASLFLCRSLSGFLITCPIKREKSATKELLPIFEKFVSSVSSNDCTWLKSCDKDSSVKKRKICSEGSKKENVEDMNRIGDGKTEHSSSNCNLSLVKLTRSGLLLFTFSSNVFHDVVGVLSRILLSLESGELKRPIWCNRIFPIQETCVLTEKNLHIVVSKLVQEYLGMEQENLKKPIKFAVAYNRRGIDETEMKNSKFAKDSKSLLDRNTCFQIVAGTFKEVAKNATVDLKSPEVVVFVELLPVSGVPLESPVAGVSILSNSLVATKPKLCVKALIVDTIPTRRSG